MAQAFLERFPSLTPGVHEQISNEARRRSGNQRDALLALARTARLVARDEQNWGNGRWATAASLGPSDEAVVRTIGLNEDRIVASTPVLRVVARLTGSRIDEERCLSDGRLAVALLVGAGKDVPALNAALHSLGHSTCTSQNPKCSECPIAMYCDASDFEAAE